MARPETVSTGDLVSHLGRVFRQKGFDGASLSDLATAAGLAKAALYHRFPLGKAAMAAAVLSAAERQMADDVLATLKAPASPAARLAAMATALGVFYEGGRKSCLIDMFSVAGTPDRIRSDIRRGAAAWIAAIAAVLAEAGVAPGQAKRRAQEAVIRIEGALVVSRALGDTAPFKRTLASLAHDLLVSGD